jgi:hypothetical protein
VSASVNRNSDNLLTAPHIMDWATSPEYLEISKDRVAATDGAVLLIRALT